MKKPRKSKDIVSLSHIFNDAISKYREGYAKYGAFNPHCDSRDLLTETINELLDSINYLAMQILKLKTMKENNP